MADNTVYDIDGNIAIIRIIVIALDYLLQDFGHYSDKVISTKLPAKYF